ncbi:mitochondrial NAD transporter [Cristinia sonorae]|uniref:Mitochondrial NAD transporter n=1 Tax=Cristinia sonorae TaxID=1940300 RepID=A0A8K0UUB9_9AGAR|nr:mitochondrial NAD transporter [Cristinia sonorae]
MAQSAHSMIAGAGGGLVASIATCPLDVIKTKLQAQQVKTGHQSYLGVAATVKTILKHDGIRGLYRGLGPTMLGYLPTWAIYFAVYDGIKSHFGEKPAGDIQVVQHIYPAPHVKGYQPVAREHPWALHILSAMTAGATSTLCTNPLWVIKTRFMTQSREEVRYRHTLDAALTIYRTEGIPAFFRGLLPSLLGILHVAVQFPLYEQLKRWARRRAHSETLPASDILVCSSIAKMTASIATYPHEVVRTRLQTLRIHKDHFNGEGGPPPSTGVIRTTKNIIAYEGWRGLYKGLSVNLVRTVPNSAVTMLTYEMLMRYLNSRSLHSS